MATGLGHPSSIPSFRLGDWLVHPPLNRICRGSQVRQLEPRVMHVLICLVDRPGEVLSREALLKIVWGETVVCEEALTRAISDLRRAFEDDAKQPRYIETIRKTGYRLVCPVEWRIEATGEPANPIRRRRRLRWAILVAFLVVAAVGATALLWHSPRLSGPPLSAVLQGVPFTSYPGTERHPAISPDGTRVAFAWDAGGGTDRDIYLKQENTEIPLRLTRHPDREEYPAWSPDGSTVAFIRRGEESGIYTVPAIGGNVRRLIQLDHLGSGLDWSPDGERLAFAASAHSRQGPRIQLLSISSLEKEEVEAPPPAYQGDESPVFSPDGASIAFVRKDQAYAEDVYQVSVHGGTPRRLTSMRAVVVGLDWTPDGNHLILSTSRRGQYELWRLTPADGALAWLPTPGQMALRPSVSQEGHRLVYERVMGTDDICRIDLDEDARSGARSVPFITSTRLDQGASFSPDGTRVAFVSTRSGHHEIWVCDAEGDDARRLTSFGGPLILRPHWSPDGDRLAMSVLVDGRFTIFVVEVEDGGVPQRLTASDEDAVVRFWSPRDGCIRYDAGLPDAWRPKCVHPDDGRIEATQDLEARLLCEGPGGETLYYMRYQTSGIWRRAAAGEEMTLLPIDEVWIDYWHPIIPTADGLYYQRQAEEGAVLMVCDFATGRCDSLYQFLPFHGAQMSISPDGRTLLFECGDAECDLMLVENFR